MSPIEDACTLPTAEQPVRLAEFDELIATALRGWQRLSPTKLRWDLDPTSEATARDLADRESRCCTFFSFTVGAGTLEVEVPDRYAEVLDMLVRRSADRFPS